MKTSFDYLKAKGKPDYTTLTDHLDHVVAATIKAAEAFGMDIELARKGAILHDIGKIHPTFQYRLTPEFERNRSPDSEPFRHELASLLFLPLFDRSDWPALIEMVVAHHKSARLDARELGIVDLEKRFGERAFVLHSAAWNVSKNKGLVLSKENSPLHDAAWSEWSPVAIAMLAHYRLPTRPVSFTEAEQAYNEVLAYCEQPELGYSPWKGLLMASDHFGSALIHRTVNQTKNLFRRPVLSYYNRKDPLYPLSEILTDSERPHTLVTACTGAGKTDFLLRRCHGRVFYTLPFQASINSMYERIKADILPDNQDLSEQIRVLHAASRLMVAKKQIEERTLQGHMGSALKVLTPHQLASIVFGTRGYEATLMDLRGCDIILDEIHTYTQITRSIVLKIVEMLKMLDCRIHIGTATMPTVLTNRIRTLLGDESVYEVSLSEMQLNKFDRHTVHKIDGYETALPIIRKAVTKGQKARRKKVLVVANRVETAQERFRTLRSEYPDMPMLLLHSRFKRGHRSELEKRLTGKQLDASGEQIREFNTAIGACIVVSTQVVEVSLDISFDLMITDAAPLDALIQRFGRVNRKRSRKTIGKFKPVYVLFPPETEAEAKPYELQIVKDSFSVLPDSEVLHERDVQRLIDQVFPTVDSVEIDKEAILVAGRWRIDKLVHYPKSVLFEKLEIDSMVCITQDDQTAYELMGYEERMAMEIPVRYHTIAHNGLDRSEVGNRPFIIPNKAYDPVLGLLTAFMKPEFYDVKTRII